ncbi:MAG TPA: hypothetical protein VFH00_13565 [Candidatus Nitrosotalea sp.]|nr:hypothetical protein [Candidatus Nitrosotalea sp.]
MSDQEDELELAALQRELDDAFETTRPRAGFEDELWTRMQARRPAGTRLRDAWLGFVQGVRAVPAVPTAAVAALLVVAIGAGVVTMSGFGRGGSTSTGTSLSAAPARDNIAGSGNEISRGAFGKLPAPSLSAGAPTKAGIGDGYTTAPTTQPSAAAPGGGYTGPVTLTWTGKLELTIPSAPVFRYHEPSTNAADQFATSLGAILQGRPAGYLGNYETRDFNIRVRGTVQSPAREPTYVLLPITALPPIVAAGGPADVASVFLAEHSLIPTWPYTTQIGDVQGGAFALGDQTKVMFLRQFAVKGYGNAYVIDAIGERSGLEVDLKGNTPTAAGGPLPLDLESASYPIISADEAIRSALASSPAPAGAANVPNVALTDAELVYALVVAGDHSFYEPAVLFSGKYTVNGTTYVKRVLVPAVDPTQRSS